MRQRLRLGAVSPVLMERYRAGELTLDQMMAYAVSVDHVRQEQVLCRRRHKTCYAEHEIMPSRASNWLMGQRNCTVYSA